MANAALDDMIARVRGLEELPAQAAKLGAPLVEAAIKATAVAGTTPDGAPWPAKKDGGRPLVNAAAAIASKAVGSTIVTTLTGPEVIHNFGTERLPKRQILPDGGAGIPPKVAASVEHATTKAFDAIMGGR